MKLPEVEVKKLQAHGIYVETGCDHCRKPILSSVAWSNGDRLGKKTIYCSDACRNSAVVEPERKQMKTNKKNEEVKTKKKAPAPPVVEDDDEQDDEHESIVEPDPDDASDDVTSFDDAPEPEDEDNEPAPTPKKKPVAKPAAKPSAKKVATKPVPSKKATPKPALAKTTSNGTHGAKNNGSGQYQEGSGCRTVYDRLTDGAVHKYSEAFKGINNPPVIEKRLTDHGKDKNEGPVPRTWRIIRDKEKQTIQLVFTKSK